MCKNMWQTCKTRIWIYFHNIRECCQMYLLVTSPISVMGLLWFAVWIMSSWHVPRGMANTSTDHEMLSSSYKKKQSVFAMFCLFISNRDSQFPPTSFEVERTKATSPYHFLACRHTGKKQLWIQLEVVSRKNNYKRHIMYYIIFIYQWCDMMCIYCILCMHVRI